ncbi:MAG: MFS transporter [Candidatus Jordarchaeaceae archaeon]
MTVTLPPEKVSKGLKNIIYDGICSQSLFTLTGGPFLVAFALIMGADNAYIGFITAVSFLSQLVQIPTIYLIEKFGKRKLITILGSLGSRTLWVVIALMPFFAPQNLLLLISVFAASSIIANISACSWNSWMRDLVPMETRGTFFAKRFKLSYSLSSTLGILAGLYIDNFGGVSSETLKSYSVIFIIGVIFGMMSVFFITRIPEPDMVKSKFCFELLKQPFVDKNFRKLLSTLGFWSFASNLATPFVAVYMLSVLDLNIAYVMLFTIITRISNIYFMGPFGKLTDRYGNKPVLSVSAGVFVITIFAWTFTTLPQKHVLSLPLLFVLSLLLGMSNAGTDLTTLNIAAKLSYPKPASTYLASVAIVTSIASGIASTLGGLFADFFVQKQLSLTLEWSQYGISSRVPILSFEGLDFQFILSSLVGAFSVALLGHVEEAGEAPRSIVVHELIGWLKKDVGQLTVIGGRIRSSPQIFYTPIRHLSKHFEPHKNNSKEENQKHKNEHSTDSKCSINR